MKKYAIMVQFDVEADDWIYVTEENKGNMYDLKPIVYDTLAEAVQAKQIWKNAKVVEYDYT
jgi:hypothetical protein